MLNCSFQLEHLARMMKRFGLKIEGTLPSGLSGFGYSMNLFLRLGHQQRLECYLEAYQILIWYQLELLWDRLEFVCFELGEKVNWIFGIELNYLEIVKVWLEAQEDFEKDWIWMLFERLRLELQTQLGSDLAAMVMAMRLAVNLQDEFVFGQLAETAPDSLQPLLFMLWSMSSRVSC